MKISISTRLARSLPPPGTTARLVGTLGLAAALLAACDIHSSTAPGTLAALVVTPDVTLPINATQQFAAVGTDSEGTPVTISPTWAVIAGGGAIDAAGLFTAGTTPGSYVATVQATSNGLSATASVVVTVGALVTLEVTPDPETMDANTTQQFTAVGRDAGSNIVPITPIWSVIADGGSIGTDGMFTAGASSGTFTNTVEARSGTIAGMATVIVENGTPPPTPPLVPLGAAESHGILAGTEVTCVTGGTISADVGISPGNTLTGFGPCVITGVQHLGDAVAAQAQLDLTTAYNTLAGLPCPPANAIVADLGGTTKASGVYCTASGIGVTGTLTLDGGGDPDATFVFQAGTSLTTAGDIVLINGAQAKNVYWQVGSSATIGTASQWQGNILALTSITLVDNANLFGRALARNGAVTLGTNNTITLP